MLKIGIIIAVLIATIFVGSNYLKHRPTLELSTPAPQQESVSQDTGVANQKKYSSYKLGLSFLYLSSQADKTLYVHETGNKICLSTLTNDTDCAQGQSVEIFNKNAADNLQTAITKQFLQNYAPTDCFVTNVKNPVANETTPDSFTFAEISFPKPTDPSAPWWTNADKCPRYATTNGIAYFLMDTKHPEKFIFLSIGQYPILAGPGNQLWQSTINFL